MYDRIAGSLVILASVWAFVENMAILGVVLLFVGCALVAP